MSTPEITREPVRAHLCVTRPQGGSLSGCVIRLTLQCATSRAHLLEVDINPDEFALAVTGLSGRPCAVTLRPEGLQVAGMMREQQTVQFSDRTRYWRDNNGRTKHGTSDEAVAARRAYLEELHNEILAHVQPASTHPAIPWELSSGGDGTDRQQNTPDVWTATVHRYVPTLTNEALNRCSCGYQPTGADVHPNGIGDFFVRCPQCRAKTSEARAEHPTTAVRRWNAGEHTGKPGFDPQAYES